MVVGGLFFFVYVVVIINFCVDYVISGVVINFLVIGLFLFFVKVIYDKG